MKRRWLTAVTVVGVAGSGGAAIAAVGGPTSLEPAATAPSATAAPNVFPVKATQTHGVESTATSMPESQTIVYQVGDAGSVTIVVDGATMTSGDVVPANGWAIVAITNGGTHTVVQLTDNERIVGFVADLVGDDVVVSVTNELAAGAPGSVPTTPVSVSIIDSDDSDDSATLTDESSEHPPLPATPPPVQSPPTTTPTSPPPPAATSTTSVVSSDDDEDHEDEVDDEDDEDDEDDADDADEDEAGDEHESHDSDSDGDSDD